MSDLLNVDTAIERILARVSRLSAERVTLEVALGRVLAEDVQASESLPPFPNSSMDGYALRAADVAQASQTSPAMLRVVMDIPAGTAPTRPLNSGEAARIMTGAPTPEGADAVVPVESTDSQWSAGEDAPLPAQVTIYRALKPGDYVRPIGEDVQAGQTVLREGTLLRPQDIGVLASLGHVEVSVVRKPRVAILSTGDELLEIDQPLAPGKIRNSNSYTLAALVTANGGLPFRIPTARDTLDDVRRAFRDALAVEPDMILSSAGVSVGALDMVRTVLDELGEVGFWRINLRPGKPLAFGQVQGIPFFGLPGNPVSAMVTFDVLVRPALLKQGGLPDSLQVATAITAEDLRSDGRRSYLRVRLHRENGQWVAQTTGTQSSGALTSMVLADGLLVIPEDVTHVPAGTPLQVWLLRTLSQ